MSLYLGSTVAGIGDYNFTGLAFGNNTFVLASSSYASKLLYKIGTANWTYLDNPNIPITNVYYIKYCKDRFLARYNDGLMYSLNGITWTKITSIPAGNIMSFDYFKGKYYIKTTVYVYPTGNVTSLYSTTNFVDYILITLPTAPVGELYSNSNILCFVDSNLPENDIGKLVYTLDGISWYYKTSDYYYKFVPYDYSLPIIPVFTVTPVTFSNYYTKVYDNNLLIPDNIVDCTQYIQSTPVKIPKPIVVIWDGTRHVYISDGYNVYTSDFSVVTFKSNVEDYFIGTDLQSNISLIYAGGLYFIIGDNIVMQSSDLVTWSGLTIGNQNTGKKVLIATSQTLSKLDMIKRKPIFCEFHSDLEYLTYKRYNATVTDYGYVTYQTGYLLASDGGPTYNICIAEFPTEFYTNYLDRCLIIIVDNQITLSSFAELYGLRNKLTSIVGYGQAWANYLPIPPNTNYPARYTIGEPTSAYRYLLVPKRAVNSANRNLGDPYVIPTVSVLVTNFKLDGTYIPPVVDYSQGIKMNSDSFFINGYDLFSLKYISNVALSASDIAIATEKSTMYLVGEDTSISGMQLISNSLSSKLIKGNTVLFDTSIGRRGHTYAGKIDYSLADGAFYGTRTTDTYTLLDTINISATNTTPINLIIDAKITSTNVKHDNVAVSSDFSQSPCFNYATKTYGAMSLCLNTSDYILIGHDEYYLNIAPGEARVFRFYQLYARRIAYNGQIRIEILIKTNETYLNSSANISLSIKAIVFV